MPLIGGNQVNVDDESDHLSEFLEEDLVELKAMDYQLYDQNYKILHKLKKIVPQNCHVVKPDDRDTNIDLALEGLQAFEVKYKTDETKELGKIPKYTEDEYKIDKDKKDKLKMDNLFKDQEDKSV